jgi:putative peptide zinc metalloprotease protein
LALVEIGVFIIWPILYEIGEIYKLKPLLTVNPRSVLTSSVISLFLFWFIVPLPHLDQFTAVANPKEIQIVYIPYDGVVKKIFVQRGAAVTQGQLLLELTSKPLQSDAEVLHIATDMIKRELLTAQLSEEARATIPEKEAQLALIKAQLATVESQIRKLHVEANFDGIVFEWNEEVTPGQTLARDFVIGKIANFNTFQAIGFVQEEQLQHIQPGQSAMFVVKSTREKIPAKINKVFTGREEVLDFNQLASVHQGELPVTKDSSGNLKLVESYYPLIITFDQPVGNLRVGQMGTIEVRGPFRSRAMELVNWVEKFIWNEQAL